MDKKKVVLEQISVNPAVIEITEMEKLETVGFCVDIIPAYYLCRIRITPYVVQSLLIWLLENDHIKLSGTLIVPIRGKVNKYVQ